MVNRSLHIEIKHAVLKAIRSVDKDAVYRVFTDRRKRESTTNIHGRIIKIQISLMSKSKLPRMEELVNAALFDYGMRAGSSHVSYNGARYIQVFNEKQSVRPGVSTPPSLFYDAYSDTIRQAPQNYMLAVRKNNRWICDPDPSANVRLTTKLFLAIFTIYDIRYGEPEKVIDYVTNSHLFEHILKDAKF